ncbi:hypothetical protein ABNIH22_13476 [Acinetobacter baumannii ABNIH22]|uniref:Uncharacterized protein n=1 Tax=Acinetobacter baumannii EGD-HP18 TaxID=1358412 RepID=A0AAV3JWB6_ACIBA|nr:hypothetical protein U476_15650 [Acinetobacter baumannii PKAB07]EGK46842.1 hypothetical protein AB210_2606 [Acinetobacter baumannii AB210]EGT93362.1 hypothetical protein ABNIH2_11321 [Acinetobacter baumannii ABNIH2]EGU02166.1 hypothetical protein ABNIH4_08895 [Acinetobacter baumannii ABNIH4]EKE61120.1 hypothetical protein B825_14956 [Acinetobacter baumannii ZWS1122]EKE61654.1 hypothetical protein B837_14782 [Acinetobacter baumannii ZWS1219]EMT85729.1 hypothetical protein ABNIH26_12495 [Aci
MSGPLESVIVALNGKNCQFMNYAMLLNSGIVT